jgi:serine/threonine-protein kinase RsbW
VSIAHAPLLRQQTAHAAGPGSTRAARREAIDDGFDLRLRVPADPAALTVIRHAVAGIATALGIDAAGVSDVRLALTEVCSTAIRRRRGRGTLEVTCDLDEASLRVAVRDEGPGAAAEPAEGLPLPLVAALTDTVELRRLKPPHGPGTEVTLTFALERC